MDRLKFLFSRLLAMMFVAVVIVSCDDDDGGPAQEPPKPFELASALVGAKDLNGATFATDVAISDNITLVFTDSVDAATATSTNIILTQGENEVETSITVVGLTITIDPVEDLVSGTKYEFEVTSGVTSKREVAFEGLSTSFTTTGIGIDTAPQTAAQTLYVQFNGDIVDVLGNATVEFEQVEFTTDRYGNADGAVNFTGATEAGNGDLVELAGDQSIFINPSMSYSIWFKIDPANYVAPGNKPMFGLAAERGYFLEIGDGETAPGWLKFATNHIVEPDPMNHVQAVSWGDFGATDGGQPVTELMTDVWHHLVMTYNSDTYEKTIYLDGVVIRKWTLLDTVGDEWNLKDITLNTGEGVDAKLALGYFASRDHTATGWVNYATATSTFVGAMDDLRIWNDALTTTEVTALYNSEKP